MTTLKKTLKADRAKMAEAIVHAAQAHGFGTILVEDGRRVRVSVKTRHGLWVSTEIDGTSKSEGFLGNWYIRDNRDVKLADAFEIVGERNRYHWQKAATYATGFPTFLHFLKLGFEQAASGAAFQ